MKTVTAILLAAAAALAGESREEVVRRLETKISVDLRDAPLAEAIEIFRRATGLAFVIVDGAQQAVRLTVRDLSARSALRLLLAPADLAAAFENGAVVIRSRRSLAGAEVLRVYDVRATLAKVQDFPGPRIGLARAFAGGVLGAG
jgi:hypothetical protein